MRVGEGPSETLRPNASVGSTRREIGRSSKSAAPMVDPMTPRDLLAVAVLVSTNFDERLMGQAAVEAELAWSPEERSDWARWRDEDAQRIGAKRALWLDVHG